MNWNRILANGGLVFCTSLIGFTATGSPDAVIGSIVTALITAGIAGFTEMKSECEEEPPKTLKGRVKKALASGLIL